MFIGRFPQKRLMISGSFAERDQQFKASYASLPPCSRLSGELTFERWYLQMRHATRLCNNYNTLQHIATTTTHCNTLQQLQHTATLCNTLQYPATQVVPIKKTCPATLQYTATHCIALQYTATHCNTQVVPIKEARPATLQHAATYCNTSCTDKGGASRDTATHCNTLQHTATHCNASFTDKGCASRALHESVY